MEEIKITKLNYNEQIEKILKKLKIKFNLNNDCENQTIYEIFISSLDSYISIEKSKEETDIDVYITFYTKINNDGNSAVENNISEEEELTDIILESEIEEFVNQVKEKNKTITKI